LNEKPEGLSPMNLVSALGTVCLRSNDGRGFVVSIDRPPVKEAAVTHETIAVCVREALDPHAEIPPDDPAYRIVALHGAAILQGLGVKGAERVAGGEIAGEIVGGAA